MHQGTIACNIRAMFLQNLYLLLGCLSLLSHMLATGHHDSERPGEIHRPFSQIHQKNGHFPPIRGLEKQSSPPPFHFSSPPLFERTDCCPLLSPGVITLHRFKEFSIGASTHCIDFLLHSCIAANLMEKKRKIYLEWHTNGQYWKLSIHTHRGIWVACTTFQIMQGIKMLSQSFVLGYKERRSCSLSFHFETICYRFYLRQKIKIREKKKNICIDSLTRSNTINRMQFLPF